MIEQTNLLVLKHTVLNLEGLHGLLEIGARRFVLTLPLVNDLFLLNHYFVGSFLRVPVLLLLLEKLVFELSNFDVAFVSQFVYSIMIDYLQTVQLTDSSVFLVTDGVDQLSESLVLNKVAVVVPHVPVEFDLDLVHLDLGSLSLVPHDLDLLSLLVALVDECPVVLLILHLSLVDLLAVLLVLLLGFLLEVLPLIDHFIKLLLEAVTLYLLLFFFVHGIRKLYL